MKDTVTANHLLFSNYDPLEEGRKKAADKIRRERRAALRAQRAATRIKQASFSSEYFYPLLQPYVHYVPVATNLQDVPEKLRWAKANPKLAEAIARRGQDFAREHLHTESIACYWWQLLTTFSALQDFQPRSASFSPM